DAAVAFPSEPRRRRARDRRPGQGAARRELVVWIFPLSPTPDRALGPRSKQSGKKPTRLPGVCTCFTSMADAKNEAAIGQSATELNRAQSPSPGKWGKRGLYSNQMATFSGGISARWASPGRVYQPKNVGWNG